MGGSVGPLYDVQLSKMGDFCVVHRSLCTQFAADFMPRSGNEYCFRVLPSTMLDIQQRVIHVTDAYAFKPPFSTSQIRESVLSQIGEALSQTENCGDSKDGTDSEEGDEEKDAALVFGIHVSYEHESAMTIGAPRWEKILFVVQQIVQQIVPYMNSNDLVVTLPASKDVESYDRGTVSERVAVVLDHATKQFPELQTSYELQYSSHETATFGGRIVLDVAKDHPVGDSVPAKELLFADYVIVISPDLSDGTEVEPKESFNASDSRESEQKKALDALQREYDNEDRRRMADENKDGDEGKKDEKEKEKDADESDEKEKPHTKPHTGKAKLVISVVSVDIESGERNPECIEEAWDIEYDELHAAAHKVATCILECTGREEKSIQKELRKAHQSDGAEETGEEMTGEEKTDEAEESGREVRGNSRTPEFVEFELTPQDGQCCFIELSEKKSAHRMFRREESDSYEKQQIVLLSTSNVRLTAADSEEMSDIIFYMDQVDNFQMFEMHDLGTHSKVHMFHHLTYSTEDTAFAPRGLWFLCAAWTQSSDEERKLKCTEDIYFNAGFLLYAQEIEDMNQIGAMEVKQLEMADPSGMLQLESLHLQDMIHDILDFRQVLNKQSLQEKQIQESLVQHRLAGKELAQMLEKLNKMYSDTSQVREKKTVDIAHLWETLKVMTSMLERETKRAGLHEKQLKDFKTEDISLPLDELNFLTHQYEDAKKQTLHLKYSAEEHKEVMNSLQSELKSLKGSNAALEAGQNPLDNFVPHFPN